MQYLHAVIHACLKAAVKWGRVGRNVADAATPPKPQRKEARYLTPEQAAELLKVAEGHWMEPILALALGTGIRRGEILALRWEDVDLEAGTAGVFRSLVPTKDGFRIQEPKTARGRRTVALPPYVVQVLRRHRARQAEYKAQLGSEYQDHGLVCAREDGAPRSPTSVTHALANLLAKAGRPQVRFRDLRHTHASMLLEQGVHPKVVQERLGHSTITVTLDLYSHVAPHLQAEAALKVEEALARGRRKERDM